MGNFFKFIVVCLLGIIVVLLFVLITNSQQSSVPAPAVQSYKTQQVVQPTSPPQPARVKQYPEIRIKRIDPNEFSRRMLEREQLEYYRNQNRQNAWYNNLPQSPDIGLPPGY